MEVRFTKNGGMICTKWRYNSSKTEVSFAENGGTIATNRLIHLIDMPVSSLEFDRTEKKYVKYIFLKPTNFCLLFTLVSPTIKHESLGENEKNFMTTKQVLKF